MGSAKRRLLLALRRGRSHGYALAASLQLPLTGIYHHLHEMESEGLVAVAQHGRRKVYRLTQKGARLVAVLEEE